MSQALFCPDRRRRSDRIDDILETIRLGHRRDDLAADSGHGQKQWLEIGMLLAQDPKLLLVDEPVAGMTDSETVETARCSRRSPRRVRSSSSSTT